MIKVRKRERRERGQTLILVLVALPLFFALMALVVDGGNVLVHRRSIQVAADAASLAIAQSVDLTSGSCNTACSNQGKTYAQKNGIDVSALNPSWHGPCANASDTNCWTYPYGGHNDQVEVRLRAPVATFFVGAANALLHGGVSTNFNVSARAVASANPVIGVTTISGQTFTGSTTTIPGETHTITDPGIPVGGSGIAFTMSRSCTSITYTGAGTKSTDVLGALATNGGLDFGGNGNRKKITSLGYDKPRCVNNPTSPPSGTDQCTATAWGNGPDVDLLCVKTLIDLNPIGMPLNWPIAPPTVPTPQKGAWNPAWYPSKCSDVTPPKQNQPVTVDVGDLTKWPPGIYCVTGGTSFQISGVEPAASAGHTFFAIGGGTIGVSSNGSSLKYYWPASCGPRPQPTDPRKSCISGYDPYTLLYATYASADGNCAICLTGGGNTLFGDNFATKPDIFPPSLTDTGALITIGGGALTAGAGMFESWVLRIGGNTGTYNGTGFPIEIPGATHTTTDNSTTIILPGSTGADTTVGTTLGTTLALTQ